MCFASQLCKLPKAYYVLAPYIAREFGERHSNFKFVQAPITSKNFLKNKPNRYD